MKTYIRSVVMSLMMACLAPAADERPSTKIDGLPSSLQSRFTAVDSEARDLAKTIDAMRKEIGAKKVEILSTWTPEKARMREISDAEVARAAPDGDLEKMAGAAKRYNAAMEGRMSTAQRIENICSAYNIYPSLVLVRRHPCPEWVALQELETRMPLVEAKNPPLKIVPTESRRSNRPAK